MCASVSWLRLSLLCAVCFCARITTAAPNDSSLPPQDQTASPGDNGVDILHCDPEAAGDDNDDTVACNSTTNEWILKLYPDQPPKRCANFDMQTPLNETTDYYEPCVWWRTYFGDGQSTQGPTDLPTDIPITSLNSTASPSPTSPPEPAAQNETLSPSPGPSTTSPTETATENPTETLNVATEPPPILSTESPTASPVSTNSKHPTSTNKSPTPTPSSTIKGSPAPSNRPSAAPSADLKSNPSVQLLAFEISLVLPKNRRHLRHLQLFDPSTLVQVTEQHLLTQFQDDLSVTVSGVDLEVIKVEQEALDLSTIHSEVLEGKVYFPKKTLASKLPTPEQLQDIVKKAFEGNSLFEYVLALQQTNDPVLSSAQEATMTTPSSSKSGFDEFIDDIDDYDLWVYILFGGAVIALIAVAILTYLWCAARRNNANDVDPHEDIKKSDTADTSKTADSKKLEGGRRHRSQNPIDDDSDSNSVATSTYSYIQDDTSFSVAPSFLLDNHERSALGSILDDDSVQTTNVPWGDGSDQGDHTDDAMRYIFQNDSHDSMSQENVAMYSDDESDCMSNLAEATNSMDVTSLNSKEKSIPSKEGGFQDLWEADVNRSDYDNKEVVTPSPLRRVAEDTRDWTEKYHIPKAD